LEVDPESARVVTRTRQYDLDDLLAGVTPDNLHPEQDFGEARGNEEW
jgi:antitoxin MazE